MSTRRKLSEESHDDCSASKKARPSLEDTKEGLPSRKTANNEVVHDCSDGSQNDLTIHDLPENMLVEVLQHLDIVKQLALQRVSSQWNTILTSPSILRARGVDQVFYMNHQLCTRYIGFVALVKRAACLELVHLYLGRQIKNNWPEHGHNFQAFLKSDTCDMLTHRSPRLKTIILSQGFVEKSVLEYCLPSSIKQVLFDRVFVCGFGTFPFYKYNVKVSKDRLLVQSANANTENQLWKLALQHCQPLALDDLETTFSRIREAKAHGKLKYELLTDVVERREPAALKDGRWTSDLRKLSNLTLTDLHTFSSCSIYLALSNNV